MWQTWEIAELWWVEAEDPESSLWVETISQPMKSSKRGLSNAVARYTSNYRTFANFLNRKPFRTQAPTVKSLDGGKTQQTHILLGPHRVFPGRLSVHCLSDEKINFSFHNIRLVELLVILKRSYLSLEGIPTYWYLLLISSPSKLQMIMISSS